MKLVGKQAERLNDAILDAFEDKQSLERMVSFGLDEYLERIADGNIVDVVFRLVKWAAARDKVDVLLEAASSANPGNAKLRRCAELFGVAPDSSAFEKVIQDTDGPFADAEAWRAKMAQRESAVARIEFPKGTERGTGFLVARDLLMTCYHVVEPLFDGTMAANQCFARFDYRRQADGSPYAGHTIGLSASEWQVSHDSTSGLDFAIVRLESAVGTSHIRMNEKLPIRGWITPIEYNCRRGGAVVILQHPKGLPLKYAPGVLEKEQCDGVTLAYSINTDYGSSGSPCFRANWDLIGIHSKRGEDQNQGCDFRAIMAQLRDEGRDSLVSTRFQIDAS